MVRTIVGNVRSVQLLAKHIWFDDDTACRVGSGESRTAYLVDGDLGVVYKVGRESANRYEHEALTAWREAGATWAPQTTLWTAPAPNPFRPDLLVLAMPYLPDDGSTPDPGQLAEVRRVCPETCGENWTVRGGHVWLIDGGDVGSWPEPATKTAA